MQQISIQADRLRPWVHGILLVLSLLFLLLRFVHLSADYPRNIRWDDGIATDEGWYASAAVDRHTWGTHLLPGDMNIAVLMPLWSLVAGAAFRLDGFGIVPLRAAAVTVFLLCAAGCALLLRRYGASRCIPLLLALLAVNPWAFAFSRSAFLEFPMVTLCVLGVLVLPTRRAGADMESGVQVALRCVGSGLCLAAAMLLKTTAVALAPVILYAAAESAGFRLRQAISRAAMVLGAAGAVYAPYWLLAMRPHMADVRFYLSVVQNTLRLTPLGFLADGSRPFRYGLGSDHLLFPGVLLLLAVSAFSARFRALWRDPLFALAGVWLVSFLGFMVKHNNDPARYFAAVIPALFMIVVAVLRHPEVLAGRMRTGFLLLLAGDMLVNAAQVSAAMLHPSYSFRDACAEIAAVVQRDEVHGNTAIGDNMPEVALQSGLRPVNLLFHADTIATQMQRYQPGWWVQFAPLEDGRCFRDVLSTAYRAQQRGAWTIFYPGQQLILWRLEPIPGASLPAALTPAQIAACAPPVYP